MAGGKKVHWKGLLREKDEQLRKYKNEIQHLKEEIQRLQEKHEANVNAYQRQIVGLKETIADFKDILMQFAGREAMVITQITQGKESPATYAGGDTAVTYEQPPLKGAGDGEAEENA